MIENCSLFLQDLVDLVLKSKQKEKEDTEILELNCKTVVSDYFISNSDQGLNLTKQQFWDSLRIRYERGLPNIPSSCACSSKTDIQHAKREDLYRHDTTIYEI